MEPPKRKKDWEGLKVRTRKEMQNGYCVIPAGTMCLVTRNYSGLHLKAAPCEHCGVRVFITKVKEGSVEIIGPLKECEHCIYADSNCPATADSFKEGFCIHRRVTDVPESDLDSSMEKVYPLLLPSGETINVSAERVKGIAEELGYHFQEKDPESTVADKEQKYFKSKAITTAVQRAGEDGEVCEPDRSRADAEEEVE